MFKNEIFLRIGWKDITQIQIIKISIKKTVFRKGIISYKLIFLGPAMKKILKLWTFPIRKKNQTLFLNSFKDYFEKMNKKIIEPKEIESLD